MAGSAGFKAALGLHVGGYVHVLAAALGLAVILELVPTLFVVIKLFGAAYLVWLGIAMIRAGNTPADMPEIQKRSARRAFLNSMLVEILNPKTALFFLAFLPQFVDPGRRPARLGAVLDLGHARQFDILFSRYCGCVYDRSNPERACARAAFCKNG